MVRIEFEKYIQANDLKIIDVEKGSTSFTAGGLNLIALYDDKDPYYFRLMLPNMLEVNEGNKNAVFEILNALNLKYKAAKVMILHKNVWAAVELFIYSPIGISSLFDKALNVLKGVYTDFKNKKKNL